MLLETRLNENITAKQLVAQRLLLQLSCFHNCWKTKLQLQIKIVCFQDPNSKANTGMVSQSLKAKKPPQKTPKLLFFPVNVRLKKKNVIHSEHNTREIKERNKCEKGRADNGAL